MINTFYWLKKTLKSLKSTNELTGKRIVFSTLRYLSFPIHQELFLANIYARKGASVYIILDDGLYTHWDTYQIHDKKIHLNPFKIRYKNFSAFKIYIHCKLILFLYKHPNIKIVYTSLISKCTIANVELDTEDYSNAISSVRRYFECGNFDENIPSHKHYYDACITNCIISKKVSIYIKETIKADLFVTSHGIYSLWGPIYNGVNNSNIPTLIYGAHAYKDDEMHFSDTLAQTLSKDSDWLEFNKSYNHLLPDQEKKIVDYFERRIKHKTKDTSIYYGGVEFFKDIIIEKKSDDIMNIALFPNIIWDGDILQRDKYFNGILDWIFKTIKLAENSKHNFIIRFHPAEASLWSDSVKLKDVLFEKYPNITSLKNVFLIHSDVEIDTYDFIKKNIDVGIVYDGVLALELTYMKIPVICPSISRFSAGNFVINPNTEKDYYHFLEDKKIIQSYFSDRDLIDIEFKKYAYWYLFKAGYFMPIYDKNKFGKIIYSKETINFLKDSRFMRFEKKLTKKIYENI